jgi:mannose-6-phosphate isomerase-like protein (cupin superfamily)
MSARRQGRANSTFSDSCGGEWRCCDNGIVTAGDIVDLNAKLALFTDPWSPKIVARLNDYEIKVVKLAGEFVWHSHTDTDELFLVIAGDLRIQMRDRTVTLGPGQLFVVPRGVEHCPIADGEVHALLIEPTGVVNTGDPGGSLTAAFDDSLAT